MEAIKRTFAKCKQDKRPAFVAYTMAGFPTPSDTVDVLLNLEAGGADIIELGMPFTDPVADGPTVEKANNVALGHGVTIETVFGFVREARSKGLKVPILLMGYYNPVLTYGEEKFIRDSRNAGANGFIIVDLPPEDAIKFRKQSINAGLSFVPLIAPSTNPARLKLLCGIADSFIYVVSRMSTTGTQATINADLPALLERVRKASGNVPCAVGFGVSTRDHFVSVGKIADGVVIGSRIITTIRDAGPGQAGAAAKEYSLEITGRDSDSISREIGLLEAIALDKEPTNAQVSEVIPENNTDFVEALDQLPADPSRFGEYGGSYVSEALKNCLMELEEGFEKAKNDPEFWAEVDSYADFIGRPGRMHIAHRLTKHAGGATIWLKREDLCHTGSHKLNNALAQVILAKRLGKTKIIAETGAGQHGIATATAASLFGMKCKVFMGSYDTERQSMNVFRMKMLNAEVVACGEPGVGTLRNAINEALRYWVSNVDDTHYVVGSAIGPHPYPTIVRTFQSVIGKEIKADLQKRRGKLPDAVVACVGGGSNASGTFYPFSLDPSVKLLGVEAGGDGLDTNRHSATLSSGSKGVLHGVKTYILQDAHGQILDTHSISAGLDYPGVGPELASWKDSGRAKFIAATDAEALEGFRLLSQLEGIIPALETSHAVWGAVELAKTMSKDQDIVICVSGRGDKDMQSVAEALPKLGPKIGWDLRF